MLQSALATAVGGAPPGSYGEPHRRPASPIPSCGIGLRSASPLWTMAICTFGRGVHRLDLSRWRCSKYACGGEAVMDDARENGEPQGVPIGAAPGHAGDSTEAGGLPEGRLWPRNDPPSPMRWLSMRRLFGLGGVLAVLLIGVGVLYWATNSWSAQTDNAQAVGDRAPISPRVNGTVVRVLVDAREGTVLIDFNTVSSDTSRTVPSAAQQPRGRLRDQGGALCGARGTCAPEPSASTAAAHVAAFDICTFGRGAACPLGRGGRPSGVSR